LRYPIKHWWLDCCPPSKVWRLLYHLFAVLEIHLFFLNLSSCIKHLLVRCLLIWESCLIFSDSCYHIPVREYIDRIYVHTFCNSMLVHSENQQCQQHDYMCVALVQNCKLSIKWTSS
jgi:hypothetical protein